MSEDVKGKPFVYTEEQITRISHVTDFAHLRAEKQKLWNHRASTLTDAKNLHCAWIIRT